MSVNIPELAHAKHKTVSLDYYEKIFRMSHLYFSNDQIAAELGIATQTVKDVKVQLNKAALDVPPDDMVAEAMSGYLAINALIQEEQIGLLYEMKEDREVFRNNIKTNDGKRRQAVLYKDMIQLLQNIKNTEAERAAVLAKFSVIKNKFGSIDPTKQITADSLTESNEIDVEFKQLEDSKSN